MTRYKIFSLFIVFIFFLGIQSISLAEELITPTLSVSYYKLSDGTKRIIVSFSARIDNKRIKIKNAKLQLETVNEITSKFLGEAVTDDIGKAQWDLKQEDGLLKDKDGFFTFNIRFDGNSTLDKVMKTIHVLDADISLVFAVSDTIKTISACVYTTNEKGEKKFFQDVPVEFSVKRLFCFYQIGSEKTDSSGTCTTEFPSTMPGDTTGKVTIVARIVDNDNLGNIEKSSDQIWGKPLVIEKKPKRGLGDTDAPLWMVYTLFVLLTGVWFHVFYVVFTIIRINLIGKKAIREGVV